HDALDQSPEWLDPRPGLALAHDQTFLDVPGRQVLQRPAAPVFRLDAAAPPRGRPEGRVTADAGLDAGLLVGAEDPVEGVHALPLPVALIQIQDDGGLLEEVGG